ncbi:hypothetical protein CEXT_712331 [Caerostris extrusa]|uniref:Uncharacterized protein n=1 Tax=Caerostris extrusa TaxID=172846 RepID=A0AAV4VQ32_CAEEX|nr:hypothetical protein CEXT_712331 [Caerostris extrusa]
MFVYVSRFECYWAPRTNWSKSIGVIGQKKGQSHPGEKCESRRAMRSRKGNIVASHREAFLMTLMNTSLLSFGSEADPPKWVSPEDGRCRVGGMTSPERGL